MKMNILYTATLKDHLRVSFKNIVFSILTLGLYYFWGKTALRSYIWSHLKLDNHPFVYHEVGLKHLQAFLCGILQCFIIILVGKVLGAFLTGFIRGLIGEINGLESALGELTSFLSIFWALQYFHYANYQRRYVNTSWQGFTFDLSGRAYEFANLSFRLFLKWIFTLGFTKHTMTIQRARYLFSHASCGGISLLFKGKAEDLKMLNYKTWLLAVPTVFLSRIYFSFYCKKYVMNHLFFQGVRLNVNYSFKEFFKFHLINALLFIFTLGLAIPVITYRRLKFVEKHYSLKGNVTKLLVDRLGNRRLVNQNITE